MKRWLLLLAIVLPAACGEPPAPHTAAPAASGTAFVLADGGSHVIGVDLGTGARGRALPAGVLSPDGRRLYTVAGDRLAVLEASTGDSLRAYPIPGYLDLPQIQPGVPAGLSHNGRYLVLQAPAPAQTRFWVADLTSGKSTTVDLNGKFDFDGIADDGSGLYLQDWLPNQPGRYSVRQFDLRAGALQPFTLTDKTENQPSMRGGRLMSVTEPTGHWQYTLYAGGPTGAFIHALELMGDFPIAWCVELPPSDPMTAAAWSIALSTDGATLYAANAMIGKLATIRQHGDEKPVIERLADFQTGGRASFPGTVAAEAKETSGTLAAVYGSRIYVPGPLGLTAVELGSGRRLATWAAQPMVRSVAVAPGGRLVAVDDRDELVLIDGATGAARVLTAGLGFAIAIIGVR